MSVLVLVSQLTVWHLPASRQNWCAATVVVSQSLSFKLQLNELAERIHSAAKSVAATKKAHLLYTESTTYVLYYY